MNCLKSTLYLLLTLGLFASSCTNNGHTSSKPGNRSTATGISYENSLKGDGFFVEVYKNTVAPNLVYIEGGRTTLGAIQENSLYVKDNMKRTVTIPSFYMDATEVANIHWLEYLYYLQRDSSRESYLQALPDTTVWAKDLAFNDSYVENYLRHPGFRYFPVVGVSWTQANDYCKWRTDIVENTIRQQMNIKSKGSLPSGKLMANYRLPTEAEWEYAALGLKGTQFNDEINEFNRTYPWDGISMREHPVLSVKKGKDSHFYANYKRGRGDYAGIAGKLNDGAMVTEQIFAYPPNDYGLYSMAGNVSEWVFDIYRPLSYQDVSDFSPVRNSDFLDEAKNYDASGGNSLIDNNAHVIKGGSWKDGPYWLAPGTRRYMDKNETSAAVGFRCAMISVGGQLSRRKQFK